MNARPVVRVNSAMAAAIWRSRACFASRRVGAASRRRTALPTAAYGAVLFMAGIAYVVLEGRLLNAGNPRLAAAVGHDIKGRISAVLYLAAIPLAFVHPWIADGIYAIVAMTWLVPDRRIERKIAER